MDIIADQVTPVSLLSSRWNSSDHCFLLESVEGGEKLGRYSLVSFQPEALYEKIGGRGRIVSPRGTVLHESTAPTIDVLQRFMRELKPADVPGVPRFFGGAVGYCSYETVHEIERLPRTKPDTLHWPEAHFFITNDLFVFDNTQQLLKLITCVRLDQFLTLEAAYASARKRLRAQLRIVESAGRAAPPRATPPRRMRLKSKASAGYESNVTKKQFMDSVRKGKEHIAKGDIIQVVLSRRVSKKTSASPLDIYRCLRVVNPSPYMYLLKMKDRAIIGSSPELLVRLQNGVAATRPIAGTRKRGQDPAQDLALERELLKDPKERAEHVMLVDLGRNDLGRVCRPGSVRVPTFMSVERYSHVMHIVSEVTGQLKHGKDGFDLMRASFPAGTLSGAPKIRAMEIIDDLEVDQRGPYAGALGYFSYSGNMDMAITIRTILWKKGTVSIQMGAGIVADSDPAREYEETENKAAGMLKTITLAESGDLFWGRP